MIPPMASADKSKAPTAGVTFLRTFVFDAAKGSGRELLSRFGAYGSFVDVQPQTRTLRQRDVSVDRPQNIGTQAPAKVLEGKKVLGDDEIRHAGGSVHGRGERHRCRIVIMR